MEPKDVSEMLQGRPIMWVEEAALLLSNTAHTWLDTPRRFQ